MDGNHGSWAVLYGNSPVSGSSLTVAVDEDQAVTAERQHTSEQLSFIVFEDSALNLAGGVAGDTVQEFDTLTVDQLGPVVDQAVSAWQAIGLSEEQLQEISDLDFAMVDLPGTQLALADHDRIQIDIDAAGVGWFVDATPNENGEFHQFDEGRYLARADGPAADRVDLLTVVAHELGHIFQHGHSHSDHQLMTESLPIGERRLAIALEPVAVEQVFDELFDDED
jgi:hypothetical protein